MDPLSITLSAAALAGKTQKVSSWLYELVQDVKNTDSKISDLSKEVTQLVDLLKSVEHMVRRCQSQALTLAHLDEHMWRQIKNALSDCELSINGLTELIVDLTGEHGHDANNFDKLLRKPSIHLKLSIRSEEIDDFTSKVYKSNCALQTSLAVVSVSLSFRTNVSQENIFQELHKLNKLVKESLKVANRRGMNPDAFSARLSRNLESLAKAAQNFHSKASSTASTQHGPVDGKSAPSIWGGSDIAQLTDAQRDEIELWNYLSTIEESGEENRAEGNFASSHDAKLAASAGPITEEAPHNQEKDASRDARMEEEEEDDDNDDIELDFLRNFEELAYSSFTERNYSKSEQFLRKAVERCTGESGTGFKQLKVQLALCCCLQEKWDHATGIIATLPKTKSAANLPTFHLLQAVALAHLEGKHYDKAYDVCKTVLQGKKKILGNRSYDYNECLWLFASICESKGESLEAEAVRHSIPRAWATTIPQNVQSATQYILNHETLIGSIFCTKPADEEIPAPVARTPTSPQSSSSGLSVPTPGLAENWMTLVPNISSDGLTRAMKDERRGTMIYETDTGKEFFVQSGPDLLQGGTSANGKNTVTQPDQDPQDRYQGEVFPPATGAQPTQNHEFTYGTPNTNDGDLSPRRAALRRVQPGLTEQPKPPEKHEPSLSEDHSSAQLRSKRYGLYGKTSPVTFLQNLHPTNPLHEGNNSGLMRRRSQPIPAVSSSDLSRQTATPEAQNNDTVDSHDNAAKETDEVQRPTRSASQRPFRQPLPHQRLMNKLREARPRWPRSEEPLRQSTPDVERSNTPKPFIENVTTDPADEPYSTLEVFNIHDNKLRSSKLETGVRDSSLYPALFFSSYLQPITKLDTSVHSPTLDQSKKRWTVQKDIGNVGSLKPAGSYSSQYLPLSRQYPESGAQFVGVSIRFDEAPCIAFSPGNQSVTICQMPVSQAQVTTPRVSALSIRPLSRKPYFGRKRFSYTDTSSFTVDSPEPRNWIEELDPQMKDERSFILGDEKAMRCQLERELHQVEHAIANLLRQGQPFSFASFASLRLEGIAIAVPDFFVRAIWNYYMAILAECALMQHAKVIPQSFAVLQYYIDSGALVFDEQNLETPQHIVAVLSCDEIAVTCSPYMLRLASHGYVEVNDVPSSFMVESAGYKHAQAEFAKLVEQQLKITTRQLRRGIDSTILEGITKSCCEQFEQRILPGFQNDGTEWTVHFEMPQDIPAFQHGQLKFSNSDILGCFKSSVSMTCGILRGTMMRLNGLECQLSNILLSGSYSKSKYLVKELHEVIKTLIPQNRATINLIQSTDNDELCSLGALSHSINS